MNRKNKKITTYFVIFSLLLIGIIYAILQANLQINGIAKIKSNTWEIYFDNIQVNENSVSIGTGDLAATIDPENNCKVDFSITLSIPGDFYEFTVDAVNNGSIDAMIGSINDSFKINGTDSSIPDYLNYTITYDSGATVEPNQKLAASTTETYKVRVEYKSDVEELADSSTLTMSFEIVYVQADENAININHPVNLYKVFQTEASNGLTAEYTGSHKDSFTQNGTQKIYYWNPTSNDNAYTILDKWNVKFGGFCWQMYRTTDTGGVKLLYNGVPSEMFEQISLSQNDYTIVTNTGNFTWDSSDSTWNTTITDGQSKEISFTVPAGDNYTMIQTGTSSGSSGGTYTFYKDGTQVIADVNGGGGAMNLTHSFGTLTSSNIIKMTYNGSSSVDSPITFKIKMITNGESLGIGCGNEGTAQQIGTSAFNNTNYKSPAYVGYMYNPNTLITYKRSSAAASDSLFGTGVTYSNGTYTLTNTSTNYDTTHHYTCNNTTGSCSTVRYYYYDNYYTELNDGRNIEEALADMLSVDDVNQTNSTIKTYIDTWYQNNMTSYTSKLEDTIFCFDRSISNLGGWNPNGGSKTADLQFKNYNLNNDLSCTNITDQFSMSNSKAQLTYPVGLMTSSEAYLLSNNTLRKTDQYYWLASPYFFSNYDALGRLVSAGGSLNGNYVGYTHGVRPVVTLKTDTMATMGDGSKLNPYIIE